MTLVVVRAAGLVTVQDLGRPGRMHEALAPGGALVPELLCAANRAVGNPDDAPALEVLGRLVVRAESAVDVARDDVARALAAGEEFEITSEPRRVAYLAIRGGIEAPLVLGGRGTQLSAGIGAPIRAGDRVRLCSTPRATYSVAEAVLPAHGAIRVLAGPDRDAFAADALAVLTAAPYRISPASDRVGTRLEGAVIARPGLPGRAAARSGAESIARPGLPGRAAARSGAESIERRAIADLSRPMVRGAIEVPGDGQPIVLGPEHPTTGGYPILAVIAHADLGRFFAIRLGDQVRFAP